MDSLLTPNEVYSVYLDQVSAVDFLWHSRSRLLAEARPGTSFHGLSISELEARLRYDREELDRWASMIMTASFEAIFWADAKIRLSKRVKDDFWRLIREIYQNAGENWQRVRFVDLLDQYNSCSSIPATKKNQVNRLFKYRHWIAHGRHWVEKGVGQPIGPTDAIQIIEEYTEALRLDISDFPLA